MKFFIGLLIGIGIAGAVAFYLNKAQNPFVDKGFNNSSVNLSASAPVSSAPLILAPGTKMQQASSAPIAQQNKPEASTPSYDFYDVLQGKKDINPKTTTASAPEAAAKPSFIVQVGAFSEPDLANNMKAKLALLGFSSKIKSQQVNDKIINRVIIGPFADEADANDLIAQLKQQDINATLINNSN
ncbi:MAG: SPOR domain-containing protein [Neisseriaceae bacterium]|nr:MAG: SPOR domain-containing protein [Neisseriaceae bacterium]